MLGSPTETDRGAPCIWGASSLFAVYLLVIYLA